MEKPRQEDRELVAALQRGKPDAFRRLMDGYRHKVINTCYRFVNNRDDAEELAQETFVEVYRAISGFREKAGLSTWIYRIAVTKSLDFLRKRGRKKRGGLVGRILQLHDAADAVRAPPSSNPDAQVEATERRRVLQRALAGLPDAQRSAFVLSKIDGLSYQEIARILGTSLPSVESLLHRAKMNLRKRLHGYYGRREKKAGMMRKEIAGRTSNIKWKGGVGP